MGFRKIIRKALYNLKYTKKKSNSVSGKNFLITGASSGIGLSLTKSLISKNKVIGVYNSNKSNLGNIRSNNLISVKCDFRNYSDFENLNKVISEEKIDVIINCAGTFGSNNQSLENIDFDNLISVFKINSISIVKILQLMEKNNSIRSLSKIVNISSDGGSIKLNNQGNAYIYRLTKSALNSISKNLSVDLYNKYKTEVVTIDPGNVKTGMNPKGFLDADKCSEYILSLVFDKKNDVHGKFINLQNKEIPW